jgi:hypothetical protein
MTTQDPQPKKLTPKQEKVIAFVVAAPTEKEGYEKAGITKNTWWTWKKAPGFRDELRRQRDCVVDDALDGLKGAVSKAVDALVELLETTDKPAVRRGVANDIIGHVLKARELQDLEDRLEKVERVVLERRTYK